MSSIFCQFNSLIAPKCENGNEATPNNDPGDECENIIKVTHFLMVYMNVSWKQLKLLNFVMYGNGPGVCTWGILFSSFITSRWSSFWEWSSFGFWFLLVVSREVRKTYPDWTETCEHIKKSSILQSASKTLPSIQLHSCKNFSVILRSILFYVVFVHSRSSEDPARGCS